MNLAENGKFGYEQPRVTSPEIEARSFDQQVLDRLTINPDLVDTDNIPRPLYSIAGHEVVFRNRQETPDVPNKKIAVVGDITPLHPIGESDSDRYRQIAKYNQSNAAIDGEASVLAVTNTPLGITEAAASITTDPLLKEWLDRSVDAMKHRDYSDQAARECIDYTLGSVSIDETGADTDELNPDGFALTLAALSGDEQAAAIVISRRTSLLANEGSRIEEAKQAIQSSAERYKDIEPVPLENLALVHTTSHQLEHDSDGNVIMRPAGQRMNDEYPRSTLHFTLNSRVAEHAQAEGQWQVGTCMVVANLQRVVDANQQKIPDVLEGVDTYYSLNPGEGLIVPNATVVESLPADAQPGIIRDNGDTISYVLQSESDYTPDDRRSLESLASGYGIDSRSLPNTGALAQEVSLRIALQRQHVPTNLMDMPSADGHGMQNDALAARVHATAATHGTASGTHFNQPHSVVEASIHAGMMKEYVGKRHDKMVKERGAPNYTSAGIAMRRQQLVGGLLPARPFAYDQNDPYAAPLVKGAVF